jgi:hypothetical protein
MSEYAPRATKNKETIRKHLKTISLENRSLNLKESARSFGQADALPGLKCLEHASPSALAWCVFSASWIPFEINNLPKIRSNNFRLSEAFRGF